VRSCESEEAAPLVYHRRRFLELAP
jgi:hypothetical protein